MKLLKRINMLGNCCLSSFSLKPFLINIQLITKCRDVMNKSCWKEEGGWSERFLKNVVVLNMQTKP